MGKLVLVLPDGESREIPLVRERITLGRRPDNDVCLPFPSVSGEHAAIVTILDDSFLEDLNSTNGTLVNGKAITKHFLRDRDQIDIGLLRFVYHDADATHAMPVQAQDAGGAVAGEPDTALAGVRESPDVPAGPPSLRGELVPASAGASIDTSSWIEPPTPGRAPIAPEASSVRSHDGKRPPVLDVLDGPQAGSTLLLDRGELVVGRLGVAIVALRRSDQGYRLVQLEGEMPATINGAPVGAEGVMLAAGDRIGIARTSLVYRQ